MAKGINKVILVGNLGADPEVRYTQGGTAVANLRLATSDRWKDKQTGEMQERTEWHRVVFFARIAEVCGEYLRKGSKVYVEGQLRTRKWTDNNQVERYSTEIVGRELQMLDGKQGGASGNVAQGNFGGQQSAAPAQQSNNPQQAAAPQGGGPQQDMLNDGFADDLDDEIPF